MTPESKLHLHRFAAALSNEIIYGEGEQASTKRCREYEAKTEAARNALVEHIEKLEDAVAAITKDTPA